MYASDAVTLLVTAIRKTLGKELPKGYNASLSCYQNPQTVLDFGQEIAMAIGQVWLLIMLEQLYRWNGQVMPIDPSSEFQ